MEKITCPHCNNPIYDDEALSCLYCGQSLHRDIGVFGKMKYSQSNPFWIIGVGAIITIIIVMFLI